MRVVAVQSSVHRRAQHRGPKRARGRVVARRAWCRSCMDAIRMGADTRETQFDWTVTGAVSWHTPRARVGAPPAAREGARVTQTTHTLTMHTIPQPVLQATNQHPCSPAAAFCAVRCVCPASLQSAAICACASRTSCHQQCTLHATTSSSSCNTSLLPCIAATCSGLQLVCVKGVRCVGGVSGVSGRHILCMRLLAHLL